MLWFRLNVVAFRASCHTPKPRHASKPVCDRRSRARVSSGSAISAPPAPAGSP